MFGNHQHTTNHINPYNKHHSRSWFPGFHTCFQAGAPHQDLRCVLTARPQYHPASSTPKTCKAYCICRVIAKKNLNLFMGVLVFSILCLSSMVSFVVKISVPCSFGYPSERNHAHPSHNFSMLLYGSFSSWFQGPPKTQAILASSLRVWQQGTCWDRTWWNDVNNLVAEDETQPKSVCLTLISLLVQSKKQSMGIHHPK